ncbi:MAG: hypothetical protein K0S78_5227, partial [Thermomicrobiales bacterium]|nr:hypothetical protein [Thermomicrobiales bacterium]
AERPLERLQRRTPQRNRQQRNNRRRNTNNNNKNQNNGPGTGRPLNCPDATIECWFESQDTGSCDVQIGTLPGKVGTCGHGLCCGPCDHPDQAYWSNLCNQTFSGCGGNCLGLLSLPFLVPSCFCCPPATCILDA